MDRPHLEAHWEKSPKVLPPNWKDYGREMKSRLLLEGGFFPGGHRDLDYFFYEYRAHHVALFTREVKEAVAKLKPRMEFSAAVFRNPVQSGRFIGQDWRRFAPFVDTLMPMDYRSHYAGDFETHLDLLAENVQQQKLWARDFRRLWIGIAAYQLYDAEREPLVRIRSLLREGGSLADIRSAFDKVAEGLAIPAPELKSRDCRLPAGARGAGGAGDEARRLPGQPAARLLPAREADAHARAGARPAGRGRRDLLRGRAHFRRALAGGGGLLRPLVSSARATRSTTA